MKTRPPRPARPARPSRYRRADGRLRGGLLCRLGGLARPWGAPLRAALALVAASLWCAAAAASELHDVGAGRSEAARTEVLAIGTFARDETEASGCGCSFYPAEDTRGSGPLLLRVNADGRGTVRVDGDLVTLRKTRESVIRRHKKQLSGGDKLLLTLRGDDVAASVNAALERSCRVADGCRSLSYRGVVGVSRGGQRAAAPAWGLCSC